MLRGIDVKLIVTIALGVVLAMFLMGVVRRRTAAKAAAKSGG